MAGLSRKPKSRPTPVMNVTPLVDVVLVLLIIFMVVLPAMQEELNIELPTIENPDEQEDDSLDPFLLSVTREGHLYFDEYRLERDKLEEHLYAANRREPTRRLVLRGDRTVNYVKVRELMKVVQNVGFPGISLRVNKTAVDDAEAFARSVGSGS